MKTVYEPIKSLFIFGSVFFIVVFINAIVPTGPTAYGFVAICVSLFFFILTLVRYFYPEWAYGENGFELLRGTGKGKYTWNEVKELGWESSRYGGRPFLLTKKGRLIYMSYLMTSDYSETLRCVVKCVQKNNPSIPINPNVLKKAQGK